MLCKIQVAGGTDRDQKARGESIKELEIVFVIKYPNRLILYGNKLGVKYPEVSMAEVNLWTIHNPTHRRETKGDVNEE